MTLGKTSIGKSVKLLQVGGEGALGRHLLGLGLTPNTVVTVRKTAPMGDPIELKLRGYILTLRKSDAEKIEVEEVSI